MAVPDTCHTNQGIDFIFIYPDMNLPFPVQNIDRCLTYAQHPTGGQYRNS